MMICHREQKTFLSSPTQVTSPHTAHSARTLNGASKDSLQSQELMPTHACAEHHGSCHITTCPSLKGWGWLSVCQGSRWTSDYLGLEWAARVQYQVSTINNYSRKTRTLVKQSSKQTKNQEPPECCFLWEMGDPYQK